MSSSGYGRLYHQFKDIKEEEYLIQIYRSGVLPTSYQIKYSDANPVQLSYGGGDKNSWDHTFIQGRELVFKFYVPRDDISVIDDLLESQYKEWYVEFSKGGVTLFFGYLKPENMYKRFETNPPYIEVELSATDGLAELKDIDFTLPGIDPVTGAVTLLEAIKNALTPVNIFLPFKIQVNTFPSEFTGYTLTTCSISESYCNAKRFYNITVEEDEEIIEPIKCWDVIEYCLKTFNCKLFQHKGYYTIVNHLELVKNSNSLTHIYDWNNIIAPISSTLETNIFKDISSELYTPYVEQQKIHPLKSITSTIINTNAGESVGIDFTDWYNVWEFSKEDEAHWTSGVVQTDGSIRLLIENTDQPWMRLKTDVHIVPEDGKTTYFRFKGDFYCWFWNKWDGNIFKSDGKLSQTDIKIRIQKDGFWSPYLSFGTPIYSPDVAGVQVPAYTTFDTKKNINLLITKEGDYNVEFFVDSLRGSQQFDALGIQLRNFEITLWDGAGNEFNPTYVNSEPTYYQVNILNTGYEDLEQELQLFDGVSLADTAALMMRKGGTLYLTQDWDRRGGVDKRKIIDINSIYILNNRMKYKNFLRCTIIDCTFQIDFENILVIQSKTYAFSSYSRNFRTGDIEAELIELIHDSRAYPAISETTKTATIIEPLTPGTDEAEQINIAVLKSAPISPWEVGDVIRAVQGDSEGDVEYYLAQADTLEHATAIGVITEIIDIDIFKYISNGYLPKEIFPCEVGQYYWLSPTEAGKMVTEPTYKEYEIEQAIGFGTEKGFYVEIDARNLNFKEIVETSQIPDGIPIYMHWENSDVEESDSYTEESLESADSSGYVYYPSDYDKALLELPSDIDCVYGVNIKESSGETLIKKFITEPNVPNTTFLAGGIWFFQTYIRCSSIIGLSIKIYVYKRDEFGVETELFSFTQGLDDDSETPKYYKYAFVGNNYILNKTDRLVFAYCAINSKEVLRSIELFVESITPTNVRVPFSIDLLATEIGIQGIQGRQGTQGLTGQQGLIGTGVQGIVGIQGVQGFQGRQGTSGTQGTTGAQGITGIQGTIGSQGLTGTGIQGATGAQGTTGIQGAVGIQGSIGIQVQGTQGTQGRQGSSGPQGFTGSQGITGAQGGQGIIGSGYGGTSSTYNNVKAVGVEFTCSTQIGMAYKLGDYVKIRYNSTTWMEGTITYYYPNDTMMTILVAVSSGTGYYSSWTISLAGAGTQGIQGVQGTQGVQGRQGTQGIIGSQGFTGTQGTTGIQGYTGIQGIHGTQGLQGRQGTIGIQGILGVQGLQGLQGIQGFLGLQGLYGMQGLTGAQGLQGVSGTSGGDFWRRNGIQNIGLTDDYDKVSIGASSNPNSYKLNVWGTMGVSGDTFLPGIPQAAGGETKIVLWNPTTGKLGYYDATGLKAGDPGSITTYQSQFQILGATQFWYSELTLTDMVLSANKRVINARISISIYIVGSVSGHYIYSFSTYCLFNSSGVIAQDIGADYIADGDYKAYFSLTDSYWTIYNGKLLFRFHFTPTSYSRTNQVVLKVSESMVILGLTNE